MDCFEFIRLNQTLIASIVAACIAWRFNVTKERLEKEEFKRKLFLEYNEKYNKLNEKLETLIHQEWETDLEHQIHQGQSLDDYWSILFEEEPTQLPDFLRAAFDYINLCSEEYYWFKKGFIDEDVWICWNRGMKTWYERSFFIKKIIEREKDVVYYNSDFLDQFKARS